MEYNYRPRPKNRNATWLLLALGLSSLLFLALGMLNFLAVRALWHFAFLLLSVFAIYVLLRYFSSSYLYTVTDAWGEPTLVISHVQGRRLSTHCRLGLSHLLSLVEVPDGESREGREALAAFRAERTRYSYLASIGDVPTQIIYGREGGVRFAIRLEGNAEFVQVLRAAIDRAAEYVIRDEEDDDDGE